MKYLLGSMSFHVQRKGKGEMRADRGNGASWDLEKRRCRWEVECISDASFDEEKSQMWFPCRAVDE